MKILRLNLFMKYRLNTSDLQQLMKRRIARGIRTCMQQESRRHKLSVRGILVYMKQVDKVILEQRYVVIRD